MSYEIVKYDDVLKYIQPTKFIVEDVDYSDDFSTPVLTAGKSFLLGYTDETKGIFEDVPVIIFDDFTSAFKYVDFPFKVKSSALKILKPVKEKSDIKYLYYKMLTTKINTTEHKRYWISKFSQIKIPLPPLPIQQKIAEILDQADALRKKTQQIIDSYDELAQSIFLDMFGDPVTNPKGWEKVRFEDLVSHDCNLTYGIVQPGEEFEGGIPCARPVDLVEQYIRVEKLKRIDPQIAAKYKRTKLQGGEILLSVRGSVGVISIADNSLEGSNVTRGIVPIWFDNKISSKLYFYYLYKSLPIQRQIRQLSKGATLIQLNLKDLREIALITPPIKLQNQFSAKVTLIEQQKDLAKQALKQSEDLFNALLQKAFKGELVNSG